MELFLKLKVHLRLTELFEIELFWHLTVCKQKYIYTKLNYLNSNCLTKLSSLK